jgi:hypothetical protein
MSEQLRDPEHWARVHIESDRAPAIKVSGRQYLEERPRRPLFAWLMRRKDDGASRG